RRLSRLNQEQRKILDYGAIIGDEFGPSLLSDVMKIDKIVLLEQLRELEQNHKLVQFLEDICRFDHPKIKEVLYSEIPDMLRKEYHSVMAHHIEEKNKDDLSKVIGDLAYHYYRCRNQEKGLEYLIMAAEGAEKGYALTEGVRFCSEALDLIGDQGFDKERLELLSRLGRLCLIRGELDKSMDYFGQLLKLSEEVGNREKTIEAYHNIGTVHKRRNDWDDAINSLDKSLKVAEKVKDLHYVAENYYDIGYIYERKGDYDKAVKCFGKALETAVNAGDSFVIAETYRAFGSISDLKGEYEDAISYFKKSLEILEKTEDLYEIAKVYNDLGISSFLKGDVDNAIEYNEKSIEMTKKIGDIIGLGYALLNAAEAYTEKHMFEKAMEHLDKARGIFEKSNEKMMIAAVYRDYGIVYRCLKDWSKSISSFNTAIDIYENQTKAPYYQAYTYYHFGLMFKEKRDKKNAEIYLEKALEIYDKLKMKKDSKKVKKDLDSL
ncbi:MAG: tetratricopeptide repeat protein, partial [Thermoplasmata archaeon]|nr:tetratricopeptide repeat protein [Thermoplasmata archaeon]